MSQVWGRRRFIASLFASATLLAGCSDKSPEWSLYDIAGHLPDLKFTLQGAGNRTVTERDLKGKTVLLFFGYASCPDICPTTLAQLSEVLQKLGSDARDVRVVFVSVDPHRDTPDILQAYVDAFTDNVTHSRGVFVFDNTGKARLLASDTEAVDAVTADLRKLIDMTRKPG